MAYSELFDVKKDKNAICKNCVYRKPYQCGGRIIQYCGVRKSRRTFNGLQKTKVYLTCHLFIEKGVTKQFDWGKKRKKMTLQELNRELDKITKKLITDRKDF